MRKQKKPKRTDDIDAHAINDIDLREVEAHNLVSAMMGCSFELSLVGEVEETPEDDFRSEADLREDMKRLVNEVERRLKNEDPDTQDAIKKQARWWKSAQEFVKNMN